MIHRIIYWGRILGAKIDAKMNGDLMDVADKLNENLLACAAF